MIAKNKGTHSKSKAICIKFHAVCKRINHREIEIEYVNSKGNITDELTKSLSREQFATHSKLSVITPSTSNAEANISSSTNFKDAPVF